LKACLKKQFVELEINKFQENFNQTFGNQIICDLRTMQTVLLSVCWLSVLGKRIIERSYIDRNENDIKKFIRARNILNNFFNEYRNRMDTTI
jgi:hypothetical protein